MRINQSFTLDEKTIGLLDTVSQKAQLSKSKIVDLLIDMVSDYFNDDQLLVECSMRKDSFVDARCKK